MTEPLKTYFVGATGIMVTMSEWLPFTIRVILGILTIAYTYYKVNNERLIYENRKKLRKKSNSNS